MNFQDQIDPTSYLEYQQYQPVKYLLKEEDKTDIPRVYKNIQLQVNFSLPWIIFVIGSSGSGKDTIIEPLLQTGLVKFAQTATNRQIRINEPQDAYLWMRPKRDDEPEEVYINNLIQEYGLIEYDLHYGNFYGLPVNTLKVALSQSRVVLVRTEIVGVKSLFKKCQEIANMLCVFLVPDSFEQLWQRIKDRDHAGERIAKALTEIKEAPKVANFFLHNSEAPNENTGESGLAVSQQSLIALVKKYCLG